MSARFLHSDCIWMWPRPLPGQSHYFHAEPALRMEPAESSTGVSLLVELKTCSNELSFLSSHSFSKTLSQSLQAHTRVAPTCKPERGLFPLPHPASGPGAATASHSSWTAAPPTARHSRRKSPRPDPLPSCLQETCAIDQDSRCGKTTKSARLIC